MWCLTVYTESSTLFFHGETVEAATYWSDGVQPEGNVSCIGAQYNSTRLVLRPVDCSEDLPYVCLTGMFTLSRNSHPSRSKWFRPVSSDLSPDIKKINPSLQKCLYSEIFSYEMQNAAKCELFFPLLTPPYPSYQRLFLCVFDCCRISLPLYEDVSVNHFWVGCCIFLKSK